MVDDLLMLPSPKFLTSSSIVTPSNPDPPLFPNRTFVNPSGSQKFSLINSQPVNQTETHKSLSLFKQVIIKPGSGKLIMKFYTLMPAAIMMHLTFSKALCCDALRRFVCCSGAELQRRCSGSAGKGQFS